MVDEPAGSWAQRVFAITLVVEDLDAAREFYGRAFGLPEHYFSGDSAVFRFGDLLINLLAAVPGTYEAPASSAYLYYTAEDKAWTTPVKLTVDR